MTVKIVNPLEMMCRAFTRLYPDLPVVVIWALSPEDVDDERYEVVFCEDYPTEVWLRIDHDIRELLTSFVDALACVVCGPSPEEALHSLVTEQIVEEYNTLTEAEGLSEDLSRLIMMRE